MLFPAVSGLINFATCSTLGFFVLLRNFRKAQNVAYFLGNSAIALYSFGYFFWQLAPDETRAFFWFKLLTTGIILINMGYLFFVAVFLNIAHRKRLLLWSCLAVNGIFILCNYRLLLYTHLVERDGFGFWPAPEPLFHLYLMFWFWQCLLGFSWLVKEARRSRGTRKQQIRYFMIAAAIGFVGGASNWPLWYGINFPPYGNILISVYAGVIAYAIVRYRLMNVNLAITRTAVFAGVYTLILGIPLFTALTWQPQLEHLLGPRWWAWLLVAYAALATAAHYANLHLQRRVEERLLAEERKAHEDLRQISQNMMRFTRLKPLLGQIVRNLVRILQLTHAAIYLTEEGNEHFDRKATWHHPPSKDSPLPLSLPTHSALAKDLTTVKTPRVLEELKLEDQSAFPALSKMLKDLEHLQASLIIPAFHQRHFLGFLALGEKRSGRIWTQDDLNILTVLSNQAALAVENAQLHEAEEQRLIKEAIEQTAADIAHGVSHQFNNRLHAILIQASSPVLSLMGKDLRKLPPVEAAKWLEKMYHELKKIAEQAEMGGEISKGIKSLAKAIPENFKPIEVPPLIEQAIDFVKIKHSKEKVEEEHLEAEILNEVPKELSLISGNPAQIHDSFMNILDNALDAIREKIYQIHRRQLPAPLRRYRGQIKIRAEEKEGWVSVTIEDDGIGIEKENIRRIFAPWFTTKGTGAKGRGMGGQGLGLYFIKRIIETHGGRIRVYSEHTKWTRFVVELPVRKEKANRVA